MTNFSLSLSYLYNSHIVDDTLSCYVSRHVMEYLSCHVMSFYVMSWYDVMSCYDVMLCHPMSCHDVMSCCHDVMLYHVML